MNGGELDGILGPDGILARAHPAYEPRPGQVLMARGVEEALENGRVLLVEAGTGTGKTLAYLIPAILSRLTVVVSTGTKTLQDQIIDRDIPFIRDKLNLPVRATAMKGRDNYLCLRRHRDFDREPLFETLDDTGPYAGVRDWARSTEIGDRAEVPDLPDDARFWRAINARADTCTGQRCDDYESCFLTLMKRRAAAAEIIVVNHHLFFADLALRQDAYGRIIPPYDRIIFDEAHLLEDVATRYFGVSMSSFGVQELGDDARRLFEKAASPAGGRGGLVREGDFDARPKPRRKKGARGAKGHLPHEVASLDEASREFFSLFDAEGQPRFRFQAGRMGAALRIAHERLSASLDNINRAIRPLSTRFDEALLIERRALSIQGALRVILADAGGDEFREMNDSAMELDAEDPPIAAGAMVTWAERRGRGVFLIAAPVDVSGALEEHLFSREGGAVLTSATLAVAGEFSFIRSRIGLGVPESADELIVPSPFDHETQAVLYLPPEMPDPSSPLFISRFVEEVIELIDITQGRAFLLFTSFANLRRVRQELDGRTGFPLITQGEGSKHVLLDRFRETQGAILLGTSSFWHGVDVPGDALSLVVVDRLPFEVPGDPLVAARIERITSRGGNPFSEYQIPAAVIELKQGLGRLIRSTSDRGVLAILDPRIRTRSYGRIFLQSLPPFPVVTSSGSVRDFFDSSGG